ncbi:AAA family ATPase [Leucobacter sp. CSA2]|uniref:AAA family ATPase n=1 Tax=Leucobacter edaphi TaxID=2796472 RepID=A0A934UWS5_9MICO|nr:AAA family ATPase [Leucobacter edaphi]MBK0420573.1 AAA family ATPase [Leucobacter edaphi]
MQEPPQEQPPTLASWHIPLSDDGALHLDARAGEVITVVGANGAGKSALATWIASNTPDGVLRRVLAQRKIWFQNSGASISAADRENVAMNMQHWDRSLESRYLDHVDHQRADIALFDLMGRIHAEDHRIAELAYAGVSSQEIVTEVGQRLFESLNAVLKQAGLNVSIATSDQQTFTAQHRTLGVDYPISQMSDGERSALLLAAEVLAAHENAVIMLDEPERHLHRSISASLIEALIEARPDCGFIVLTHDLDLAVTLSTRPGEVLSALGVKWSGNDATHWSLQRISPESPITDEAKRAILGGRRRILFVEGTSGSLDFPLYGTLLPGWTVVPAGSCESVIRSVGGLSKSEEHHWVDSRGLVDRDGRSDSERADLAAKGIFVLPVSEVENLYYLPNVIEAVAKKQADAQGEEVSGLVRAAKQAGLDALSDSQTLQRLAKKLAKDEVARKLLSEMPDEVGEDEITLTLTTPYPGILQELEQAKQNNDYEAFVRKVPVRDTSFRAQVARALLFLSITRYEKAALLTITENPELAAKLSKDIFGEAGSPEWS